MEFLILELFNNLYNVFSIKEKKEFPARITGKFRSKITPIVGDYILGTKSSDGFISIEKIINRKNILDKPHVANITHSLILMSKLNPKLDLLFIQKLIIQSEIFSLEPIIIITKNDLDNDIKFRKHYLEFKNLGYKIVCINNLNKNSWKHIKKYVVEGIFVLAGKSGVGKTSMINNFLSDPKSLLSTNTISTKSLQGKHTTRNTKLLMISEKLWLLDTPGFSDFDLNSYSIDQLKNSFSIFKENAHKCKFSNCTHINEPGCEIKRMVDNKKIPKWFYENYVKIIRDKNIS